MNKQPDLLLRARLQLEEGNTTEALQVLKKFTDPDEQEQQEIRYLRGWAAVQLKDWQEAITMLAPVVKKAEEELEKKQEELQQQQAALTDREQLAHYLLQLGIAAINLEHYQDAILHLNACLKVLHDRRVHLPTVRIEARYSLGTACMMRGLYPTAIERYKEAIRLCEYYDRPDEICHAYYGLAETYRHTRDYVSAYEYAQKALEIYHRRNDRTMECRVHNSLGLICHLLGKQEEAAKHYNESTLLANLIKKPLMAMLNSAALANMYVQQGDLSTARRHSDMAREYIAQLERPVLLDSPYQASGKVAHAEAQQAEGAERERLLNEAVCWYKKGIAYLEQTQAKADLAEIYGEYAYVLEDLGRQKEALTYWRHSYTSLKDSKDSSF